ncbi:MAG: hypothetical protein KKC68_00245 [Candidatus Thermoplasmatota archaeon]|nr:hypothetical protein [Candidatus Thermoplasmatota archaeon]MBU1940181.1 hypothetical protein [Candidatus Thermoplasmatota archaeon]
MNTQYQAFAPGHISGFFEPIINNYNIQSCGSRGAGFSITLGATSTVILNIDVQQKITVYINKKLRAAPVTTLAVQHLLDNEPFSLEIHTTLDLPTGQGFGMSAAGALSTSLAVAKLLNKPASAAIEAAHYAEVTLHTGLGDVIASSFGGIEIRKEAGLPPWGVIEHILGSYQVVLCVMDKKIHTKSILQNESYLHRIQNAGRQAIDKMVQSPTLDTFFNVSYWFSQQTGLLPLRIKEAIDSIKDIGRSSQCMLGNSLFAIGDTKELCQRLCSFGPVYVTTIDEAGARLLN